jgi:hypothetical protein
VAVVAWSSYLNSTRWRCAAPRLAPLLRRRGLIDVASMTLACMPPVRRGARQRGSRPRHRDPICSARLTGGCGAAKLVL